MPSQADMPLAQITAQAPDWHACPTPQVFAQTPQLVESVLKSIQTLPHLDRPVGHSLLEHPDKPRATTTAHTSPAQ
jgi:hypothetical protein